MDNFRSLENIEDAESFSLALSRASQTKKLSPATPYTFWTTDFCDTSISPSHPVSPLGAFSADFRRLAEHLHLPFILIAPVSIKNPNPKSPIIENPNTENSNSKPSSSKSPSLDNPASQSLDSVFVRLGSNIHHLDISSVSLGTTRVISVAIPDFDSELPKTSELTRTSELSKTSKLNRTSELSKDIALGFGGYRALKFLGVKPSVMHLNSSATVFSALARLDELVHSGMNIYEALVYTRKHTLYAEHSTSKDTEYTHSQFVSNVYPNIKSPSVKKWLDTCFVGGNLRLDSLAIELSEANISTQPPSTFSADFTDVFGQRPNFSYIPTGIDTDHWLLPDIRNFYIDSGILTSLGFPAKSFKSSLASLSSDAILSLKRKGRQFLNSTLKSTPDYKGDIIQFRPTDILFYQNSLSGLALADTSRLRSILEDSHAHLISSGTINRSDSSAISSLKSTLASVSQDPFLRTHVHFFPSSSDSLTLALSAGTNVFINSPSSAPSTLWQHFALNLSLLISDITPSLASFPPDSYLSLSGATDTDKQDNLYSRMEFSASAWSNPFDLETFTHSFLATFLPTISGTRMLRDYLSFIFEPKSSAKSPEISPADSSSPELSL